MLPCTGITWTCPSLGLCAATRSLGANADRDVGTFNVARLAAPLNVSRYSGYSVFEPPLTATSGTQGSFFSHSNHALFSPGRKWGTQCRLVPPFSANADALQVSVFTTDVGSYAYVVE